MNGFWNYYRKLELDANKLGYFVSSIRPLYSSNVNHSRKRIEVRQGTSYEVLYEFCHELGHCVIHNKIKRGLLNEMVAWIIGIYFCIKVNIRINYKYAFHSISCLKT